VFSLGQGAGEWEKKLAGRRNYLLSLDKNPEWSAAHAEFEARFPSAGLRQEWDKRKEKT
jgi:hypothetical protein